MSYTSLFPLTVEEIHLTALLVRKFLLRDGSQPQPPSENLRFICISLREPSRRDENSHDSGRYAEVVTLDHSTGLASELVVCLKKQDGSEVISCKEVPPGKQPLITGEECYLAEDIVKTSDWVKQILQERYGIEDISRVTFDPWTIHLACEADHDLTKWREKEGSGGSDNIPARLVQCFGFVRRFGIDLEDNGYACPIDIVPVVDLNARRVIHIGGLERTPAPKLPQASVNFHRDVLHTNTYLQTQWRSDVLKTLNVVQPDGPSFRVNKYNVVEWQNWKFQVGFNYREGLVLHNISFHGRSVVKRAALVETAVPYADPYPPHQTKCAFDVGDYGVGYCARELELGSYCLGQVHFFDAVLADSEGEPYVEEKVVCMYEEDQGLLWKHVEYRNNHNESRRARELVLSCVSNVGNYEHLFYWRLKLDGTIDYEVKLTGILSTSLLAAEEDNGNPTHGVLVAPSLNSQFHQHMFCFRLDMAVDGLNNYVSEVDVVSQPVDTNLNPFGNAFTTVETIFNSEKEAIRKADMTKARTWKIANSSAKNPINGKPTAYKLIPFTKGSTQPTMLADPSSAVGKKAAFASANLWVTPYRADERFPAGEYTSQGDGSNGLPDWTAADRCIIGCEEGLVVWHTFSVCHIPRAEDFPVMPCEITGFTLKPDNFFQGNPAIDVPPDTNAASRLANGCCSKEKE